MYLHFVIRCLCHRFRLHSSKLYERCFLLGNGCRWFRCCLLGSIFCFLKFRINMLDQTDISLDHLLRYTVGGGIMFNRILARISANFMDCGIQQIPFRRLDLLNRPIRVTDILFGRKLAILIGHISIYQFSTLINTILGTSQCCVALGVPGFSIHLGDGHCEFL